MNSPDLIRARTPYEAALHKAYTSQLPLGKELSITDRSGETTRYIVTRSVLSKGMDNGGYVQLRRLNPGDRVLHDTHTIYATSPQEAAAIYGREMGHRMTSSVVKVDDVSPDAPDDQPSQFFRYE